MRFMSVQSFKHVSYLFIRRQAGIIDMIYDPTALQCKNCGLRFSSSQSDSVAYSQHLDWHFRIKRREKDNAKKAESRRWYFEKVDWIISDEIEDEKGIFFLLKLWVCPGKG